MPASTHTNYRKGHVNHGGDDDDDDNDDDGAATLFEETQLKFRWFDLPFIVIWEILHDCYTHIAWSQGIGRPF